MTNSEKEYILEAVMPYPSPNDSPEKEAGYHEACDNFIKALDKMALTKKYRAIYPFRENLKIGDVVELTDYEIFNEKLTFGENGSIEEVL